MRRPWICLALASCGDSDTITSTPPTPATAVATSPPAPDGDAPPCTAEQRPLAAGPLLAHFDLGIAIGGYLVVTAALVYLVLVLLVNHGEVTVTPDALVGRYRPLPLLDGRRIPRAGLTATRARHEPASRTQPARWVVEVECDGRWQMLAALVRSGQASYLRDVLADACDLGAR